MAQIRKSFNEAQNKGKRRYLYALGEKIAFVDENQDSLEKEKLTELQKHKRKYQTYIKQKKCEHHNHKVEYNEFLMIKELLRTVGIRCEKYNFSLERSKNKDHKEALIKLS